MQLNTRLRILIDCSLWIACNIFNLTRELHELDMFFIWLMPIRLHVHIMLKMLLVIGARARILVLFLVVLVVLNVSVLYFDIYKYTLHVLYFYL